jgi:hypothetical protein
MTVYAVKKVHRKVETLIPLKRYEDFKKTEFIYFKTVDDQISPLSI